MDQIIEKNDINIQDRPEAKIALKDGIVYIDQRQYELSINYRDAFQTAIFQDRYTKLLQKYHYIVGDWGHDQLRLKGFYAETVKQADNSLKINALDDYLKEYCAFGCAYFVLKSLDDPIPFKEDKPKTRSNHSRRKQSQKNKQFSKPKNKKHNFIIRKGDNK